MGCIDGVDTCLSGRLELIDTCMTGVLASLVRKVIEDFIRVVPSYRPILFGCEENACSIKTVIDHRIVRA
jgi:hypothetical protein